MRRINVQEAKTHLSRILEDAVRGEDIVIAKGGRPYVRLVPYVEDSSPRVLGAWAGKMKIARDFDRTPEDVIALFEGEAAPPKRRARRRPDASTKR